MYYVLCIINNNSSFKHYGDFGKQKKIKIETNKQGANYMAAV